MKSAVSLKLKSLSISVAGLSAAVLLAASPVSAVNLVQNGDFTATTLSSPGGYICTGSIAACAVSSNVTHWTSTCDADPCGTHATPDSLIFGGTNGSAFNGDIGLYSVPTSPLVTGNIIALDGASGAGTQYSATLSQSISGLTVGKVYALSFVEAGAQQKGNTGATTEDFLVSFGAAQQTSASVATPSGGFSGWKAQTLLFTATAVTETLSFLGQGTPAGDPPVALLADVSISTVPEPASWALMIVGAAGLGLSLRAKRRDLAAAV